MSTRTASIALVLAVLVGALAGCTRSPEPSAEPTPVFSSEAEAFAAAEETYRAYVDALNEVDLSDPETFEGVYAWTTGEANANERKTLSQMHADRWTVSGQTLIPAIHASTFAPEGDPTVTAVICSDVRSVSVVDSDGASMVSEDRPDVYALEVEFSAAPDSPTGLLISSSNAVEDARCTSP